MQRYTDWLVRHRVLVLLLATLFLATSVQLSRGLSIDTSLLAFFADDDPTLERFASFQDQFGSDQTVVVLVEAPDIFRPDVLQTIADLSSGLENLEEIDFREVLSLSTANDVIQSEGGFEIQPWMRAVPLEASEAKSLRERVLAGSLVDDGLVSRSGEATAIVARFRKQSLDPGPAEKKKVLAALQALLVANRPSAADVSISLIGAGEIDLALSEGLGRDNAFFLPLTILVLVAVLVAILRSIGAALASLLAAASAMLVVTSGA